jgi:hypothetical protein
MRSASWSLTMADQRNYKQQIGTLAIGDSIGRIFSPEDYVIEGDIGDYFLGLDLEKENVELHFYSQGTNQIIKSVTVPLSEGIISIKNIGTTGTSLRLNFFTPGQQNQEPISYANSESLQEKYLSDLPAGTYDVFINFFSDELGSYNDVNWRIKRVSNSKRELVLHAPINEIDQQQYGQFIIKSIFGDDFQKLIQDELQPANQPAVLEAFKNKLEPGQLEDSARVQNFDAVMQTIINDIYTRMIEFVDNEFNAKRFRIERTRFVGVLDTIISDSIDRNLETFAKIDGGDSEDIPLVVNQ